MQEKSVVFYERLDRGSVNFSRLRLVFDDHTEIEATLDEFEINDEYNPDPGADPMKTTAQWEERKNQTPFVRLIGSQTAYDAFWEHVWPSGQDDESSFHS